MMRTPKLKGFNVKVTSRFCEFSLGEDIYLKAVEFKHSTPILFAELNRKTGAKTGRFVDGNELNTNFDVIM